MPKASHPNRKYLQVTVMYEPDRLQHDLLQIAYASLVPQFSRFLAALDQASVKALRRVFLQDALARPGPTEGVGGLWNRQGQRWVVFDLDGTTACPASES